MIRALMIALLLAAPAMAQERLKVSAVAYPLAWMAEGIGGDLVEVTFPVPADADPAFWRPNIAAIAAFQQSDVILLNGAGFADWTAKASLPRRALTDTSAGITDRLIETEAITHSHGDDDPHSHAATATFLWLDPAMAQAQADAVHHALSRRMSAGQETLDAGHAEVTASLTALTAQAEAIAASHGGTRLLASHPRYQYLARAARLEVTAVSWASDAVPDADQIAELSALQQQTGAAIMLWEETPPDAAIEAVAALGLTSVLVPTLANRPETGDYATVLAEALARLSAALAE
ncbi:zinc transport system substrate-binding protein [Rubricella aquisinus]|uniref:Zinc transport system substrate-binding protein n=1 Tax=Rubricella aquisinus TaxID=2028108 RepID=A0A840WZ51_9RHOB|nr:metal ABC transporter substrate-binding protein [Rubricella aquisinus]MBB5514955.1 zinc transport system substrate-binding protein [Rubricella aquisinus]